MGNGVDLHMHSFYSDDGEFSPLVLVQKCKAAGVRVMSITDHNSVKATKVAKEEAEKQGIKYISSIEIDCVFQGLEVHLLGYGIDETAPDFEKLEQQYLASERKASAQRLVLTRNLGFTVSEGALNALSNNEARSGVWIGEMFAEVLLGDENYLGHDLLRPYRGDGPRGDNPYVNFYWDYYAQGKPCYVKMDLPQMTEAIKTIQKNGGKAVLAHPGNNLKGKFELFDEMVKAGIDGVEVFSSYHDDKTTQYFYEQAQKHSLCITCGSDYHGKTKPSVILGETGCWAAPHTILANRTAF